VAARSRRLLRLVVLLAAVGQVGAPSRTAGQQTTPNQAPAQTDVNCRTPANPHRRQHICNDVVFGLDETLAGGWNEIRRAAMRVGITPTASYIGALQTNATGGQHEVWSYAGLLTFAASANLKELVGIPGLSVYVGASWGTGSNLAAALDSAIPTSGLYAPSFYLGEMYLQQNLAKKKLTILAGRLSAANSFASLPVFANYVNYGIDPNPYSPGANDVTFFGPPTGTEWAAQTTYALTPSLQIAAGAFNTNIQSANGENHGADFTLQEGNKGVLAIGEIDYLCNQKPGASGKPGQITLGALHNSNSFPYLTNPQTVGGGYSGIYLMGQQMIFRPDGPGTSRGANRMGHMGAQFQRYRESVSWILGRRVELWGADLSAQERPCFRGAHSGGVEQVCAEHGAIFRIELSVATLALFGDYPTRSVFMETGQPCREKCERLRDSGSNYTLIGGP
jgi:hypothetical protein